MDELISVRRSTASVLKRNDAGDKVELKSMMPKHTVKTVNLEYDLEVLFIAAFNNAADLASLNIYEPTTSKYRQALN